MRKSLLSVAICLAAALPALAESYTRIMDEATFRTAFVGNTMFWKGGSQVTHADGSLNGTIDGDIGAYTGSWAWQAGFYCRNLIIQGNETGTDCLKIEIDGKKGRMTRDQGRGRVYEIEIK